MNALWPWSPALCFSSSADSSAFWQCCMDNCRQYSIVAMLYGHLQTVQHFGNALLGKSRQYNILAMLYGQLQTVPRFGNAVWTAADSTAFWRCCIGKVQTVKHVGNAAWGKCRQYSISAMLYGKKCRQYSMLAMLSWESADSTAFSQQKGNLSRCSFVREPVQV